jgi:hypothetical protein
VKMCLTERDFRELVWYLPLRWVDVSVK